MRATTTTTTVSCVETQERPAAASSATLPQMRMRHVITMAT